MSYHTTTNCYLFLAKNVDILQGRLNGDPLVFHEVIDMGGEPISTNEYFGVGKVTEFRACTWVGNCIRNNDFGCLQGFGNVS
jgi:alpha-amylase